MNSTQRRVLRDLADEVDIVDLVRAIAGIVQHDVDHVAVSIDAGTLLFRAANMIRESETKPKRG